MNLSLVRILFVGLSAIVGLGLALTHSPAVPDDSESLAHGLRGLLTGGLAGLGAVGLEIILARRMASMIPSILLGIVLGVGTGGLADWFLNFFDWYAGGPVAQSGPVFLTWLAIYLWVTVILQTRETFKVSIPYVDFKRQGRGLRPLVVDASALIDGRLSDLAGTHLIDVPIVVPRFVLRELQLLADDVDDARKQRGRRGLEKMEVLRDNADIRLDETAGGTDRDRDLIETVQRHDGILVTLDDNVKRVAGLQDIDVININEVAGRMTVVHLPGETLDVELVKPGENPNQGIGYLVDGTMVVVDNGSEAIGGTVRVRVSRMLQTNNGLMVFAERA